MNPSVITLWVSEGFSRMSFSGIHLSGYSLFMKRRHINTNNIEELMDKLKVEGQGRDRLSDQHIVDLTLYMHV